MSPCVGLTLAGIVLDRPATHGQVQAAGRRDVAEDNVGGERVAGLERGHCDERLRLWNSGLYERSKNAAPLVQNEWGRQVAGCVDAFLQVDTCSCFPLSN
jgi:hypothetical protein